MISPLALSMAAPHRAALAAALAVLVSLSSTVALAAPGAHGPGGEHLDQPGGTAVSSSHPRIEARSDLFELVAELRDGELTILVDRYETNEPVLGADLEVESGGRKAKAKFRGDRGDYAVDDPAFLKGIAADGEHALVFTLKAGNDMDLLDGTLAIGTRGSAGASAGRDLGHLLEHSLAWIVAAIAAIGVIAVLVRSRKRRAFAAQSPGGRQP
ncbi:MAG: hypothetical protein AB7P08_04980 [Burkholderiales bacterium]